MELGFMMLLLARLWVSTAPHSAAPAWSNPRVSTTKRRAVLDRLILVSPFSVLVTPSFARNLPEPTSADMSRTGTPEGLVPILRLQNSLNSVELYLSEPGAAISGIFSLLKPVPRDETSFKSIFDQYSDPFSYKQKFVDQNAFLVYYTKGFDGPGRPSIESDLPVKQTLQYGARNDAWVAYDDFLAELDFQKENRISDVGELLPPVRQTLAAIESYLAQAPQADKDVAKALIENTQS